MDSYLVFQHPQYSAHVISVEECLEDKQFLPLFRGSLFLFQDDSVSTKRWALAGQSEFVGKKLAEIATITRTYELGEMLCSCCWCEIRQGKFHSFTLSTAAGKFYYCYMLWLLLVCQKWIFYLAVFTDLDPSLFGIFMKLCDKMSKIFKPSFFHVPLLF